MPLLARSITTPLTLDVRAGAVSGMASLLADRRISTGGAVAIAVGPGQGEQIAAMLHDQMPEARILRVGGASMDSAAELLHELRAGFFDAVVGIGGGQTIDVAKYAATMMGLPFVSVATSLSHDGIASPVSVLQTQGRKTSIGVHIPIAVVVDLDYVRTSPSQLLRAGLGDALSNLSAVADWELAARDRGEAVDGLARTLARTAAEALVNHDAPLTSTELLTSLAEALVLSGMAMTAAGSSRPCSGACHEISHAIDALYPDTAMHGEQVAVGALFATFLREDPPLATLDACLRRYGLPRVPQDLGLTLEEFTAAVIKAPSTRPQRYTVLEHLDLDPAQARDRVEAFVATVGS